MGNHLVVWPRVAVNVDGKRTVLDKGDKVPSKVSDSDVANLIVIGAIAAIAVATAEPDESEKSDTVAGVLEDVGDDKGKAAAALEVEQAKGDKARSTLVEKLTAIAAGS